MEDLLPPEPDCGGQRPSWKGRPTPPRGAVQHGGDGARRGAEHRRERHPVGGAGDGHLPPRGPRRLRPALPADLHLQGEGAAGLHAVPVHGADGLLQQGVQGQQGARPGQLAAGRGERPGGQRVPGDPHLRGRGGRVRAERRPRGGGGPGRGVPRGGVLRGGRVRGHGRLPAAERPAVPHLLLRHAVGGVRALRRRRRVRGGGGRVAGPHGGRVQAQHAALLHAARARARPRPRGGGAQLRQLGLAGRGVGVPLGDEHRRAHLLLHGERQLHRVRGAARAGALHPRGGVRRGEQPGRGGLVPQHGARQAGGAHRLGRLPRQHGALPVCAAGRRGDGVRAHAADALPGGGLRVHHHRQGRRRLRRAHAAHLRAPRLARHRGGGGAGGRHAGHALRRRVHHRLPGVPPGHHAAAALPVAGPPAEPVRGAVRHAAAAERGVLLGQRRVPPHERAAVLRGAAHRGAPHRGGGAAGLLLPHLRPRGRPRQPGGAPCAQLRPQEGGVQGGRLLELVRARARVCVRRKSAGLPAVMGALCGERAPTRSRTTAAGWIVPQPLPTAHGTRHGGVLALESRWRVPARRLAGRGGGVRDSGSAMCRRAPGGRIAGAPHVRGTGFLPSPRLRTVPRCRRIDTD
mmetsp:Transcript_22780/g.49939  ORF Transcript_22780/g.49939 Transcript_22780/m.49939 type:complete len:631 (-) Transcript_22780:153-2045(-)